jgi:Spy/CpxP family protein refolding chaperone
MKSILIKKRLIAVATAVCLVSIFVSAQGPGDKGCPNYMDIPDLTAEQKAKIDEMHISHLKDMNTYRAEVDKLEAELRVLEIADKPDTKVIDAKIDEISGVKNKMDKERSKHHQEVRALLTDSQKVIFDSHQMKGYGCKGTQHKCKHDEHGNTCKKDSTAGKHCPNHNKVE